MINNNGLKLIQQFEGCRLSPYFDDAGVATIGFGATFYEDGSQVKITDAPITQQRADELLNFQINAFENRVNELVVVPMTENQRAALVSFAFNLGTGSLKDSTLLKKLNSGDVLGAAVEFSRWHFVKKKPIKGLLRRRVAEMQLFLND